MSIADTIYQHVKAKERELNNLCICFLVGNPEGVAAIAQGCAVRRYPGKSRVSRINPERVASI